MRFVRPFQWYQFCRKYLCFKGFGKLSSQQFLCKNEFFDISTSLLYYSATKKDFSILFFAWARSYSELYLNKNFVSKALFFIWDIYVKRDFLQFFNKKYSIITFNSSFYCINICIGRFYKFLIEDWNIFACFSSILTLKTMKKQ